jgi:hypothetical protein
MYEALMAGSFVAMVLGPCFVATYASKPLPVEDEPAAKPNRR